ncbi:MAG: metal ABC transporter permease [Alphaproteobacteria bacterium CG_4_10_14_0_2_um_filter_63_37]|nr:MAG: metal ABC transporter permease [Alphaproteobacteria bacterium CG_4_10_14_0_2_um_filter_63_37]
MIALFQTYPFLLDAVIAGLVVALVTGAFSVIVLLQRLAFMGVGIGHAAFGGVAIGWVAGISPLGSAMLFAMGVATAIHWAATRGRLPDDSVIGIFFSAAMAFGVLLVGLYPAPTPDLMGFLFGDLLAVTHADLELLVPAGVGLLILAGVLFESWTIMSFHEDLARTAGLATGRLKLLALLGLAMATVLAIKMVGVVLASALLIAPAATARRWSHRPFVLLLSSLGVAVTGTLGGIALAWRFDWPVGATIVLVLTTLFLASLAFKGSAIAAR